MTHRGVIQGDIISSIFFIIALDELVQNNDRSGTGISVGHMKSLRTLGYADDASMLEWHVEDMTVRLTEFANAALEREDMKVKLAKTFNQHLQRQEKVGKITTQMLDKKMQSYKYQCEFAEAGYTQRFKTKRDMKIHMCTCIFNYGTTDEAYQVDEITTVFGKAERRLFKVKWDGYTGQDSWVPEHSLLQDGCMEAIKTFWEKTGKNPAQDLYTDPDGDTGTRCLMCGWKSDKNNKKRGLQMHIRRKGHEWTKTRAQLTERKDIMKARQDQLPKVRWGEQEVCNC